ncbi:MAG: UvrD-helicase domain-containing protein [Proteobacteria bacterium]|nr:UvrD-helicase domain-containing protein [Pseudomonadota bacterium]
MKTDNATRTEIIVEKVLSWVTSSNDPAHELAVVAKRIKWLSKPTCYPSACILQPLAERTERIVRIPPLLFKLFISAQKYQNLQTIAEFYRDPHLARDKAIARFIKTELHQMQAFFDTIEANPLTPEQRLAVVTDEDATLILAAAGSGKTSVIVAKAAYLIERNIRKPHEILLMSFAKDAATEMSERIKKRCDAPVNSRTFHSLAHKVIAEVEGDTPALVPYASDDAGYKTMLREIIMECAVKIGEITKLLIEWFCEFFKPSKSVWDFSTPNDYFTYIKSHGLRTFGGQTVRSFEELEIANWLYRNGIKYEYEPDYEHTLPDTRKRKYTPDFRLTESGIYIEHFGVRREIRNDGTEYLTTAPHIDRKKYLEGMDWKRAVHKEHGTILIETFSYEKVEGNLIRALAQKIAPYEKFTPIPPEHLFERLREMGEVDSFTGLLGTFLKHFKGAGLTIATCRERNKELGLGIRGEAFLKIFEFIFDEYQTRLGTRIDFEDMIIRATDHITSGRYQSPFRHILVDEFQDISKSRANLLRALHEQHDDGRIFAVGDDWQSIYRFAGADVYLMSNFGEEFGGYFADKDGVHQTVDLGRTFRSVDQIASPARGFILKNPAQIKKKVKSLTTTDAASIFVVHSEWDKGGDALDAELKKISTGAGVGATVLLLGRYNKSRPEHFRTVKNKYPNLKISFKTIHGAKGLEADYVIILRAISGRGGLPSEIADDPLLNLVLPTPELFHHAEERRVFYVALTRARKSVTILTSKNRASCFVTELLENPDYGVIEIGDSADIPSDPCPKCSGRMTKRTSKYGVFLGCVNYPLCDGTRKFVEPPAIQEPLTTNR